MKLPDEKGRARREQGGHGQRHDPCEQSHAEIGRECSATQDAGQHAEHREQRAPMDGPARSSQYQIIERIDVIEQAPQVGVHETAGNDADIRSLCV